MSYETPQVGDHRLHSSVQDFRGTHRCCLCQRHSEVSLNARNDVQVGEERRSLG
jgi:hypothetical protein